MQVTFATVYSATGSVTFGQATSHLEREVRRLLVSLGQEQVDVSKVRSHGTIELTSEGVALLKSYADGASALWASLGASTKKKALPSADIACTSGAANSSGTG